MRMFLMTTSQGEESGSLVVASVLQRQAVASTHAPDQFFYHLYGVINTLNWIAAHHTYLSNTIYATRLAKRRMSCRSRSDPQTKLFAF